MGGQSSRTILALALLILPGCSEFSPGDRTISCESSLRPEIAPADQNGENWFTLKVMTYNVEGLPPPARTGRRRFLIEIRDRINALIAENKAPDILVVQEMFSDEAIAILKGIAYPNFIYGPTRFDLRGASFKAVRMAGMDVPISKLQPSGLAIFSRYPIRERRKRPFRFFSCAGLDCLANKGGLMARVSIPGVPVPLIIATTHMNAQDVSKVPEKMHLRAHHQQTEELADLLDDFGTQEPIIVAGDFNMRHAPRRFKLFAQKIGFSSAHAYCKRQPGRCLSDVPLTHPAPWMTTQDLQFYNATKSVNLQPQRLELKFRTFVPEERLSDHSAQLVTWRVSWPMHMKPLPGSCNYEAPAFERLLSKAGI